MLDAGEDPRFLARRVVITAAKDVGMADPAALRTAMSAWEAVERLGMPDARTPLLEAAVYVAVAPKSDSMFEAAKAASDDIRINGMRGDVPMYLRTPMDDEQQKEGEGAGYLNPHDFGGFVQQSYMPEGVGRRVYYKPKDSGTEHQLIAWVDSLRKFNDGTPTVDAAGGAAADAAATATAGEVASTGEAAAAGTAADGAAPTGGVAPTDGAAPVSEATPAASAQDTAAAQQPADTANTGAANKDAANAGNAANASVANADTANSNSAANMSSNAASADTVNSAAVNSAAVNSATDGFPHAVAPRARHAEPDNVSDHVEEAA